MSGTTRHPVDRAFARALVEDQYAAVDPVGARGGLALVDRGWDTPMVRTARHTAAQLAIG